MNVKVKSDWFITLNEAKTHLRVSEDFVDEDSYILQLIQAATGLAEDKIEMDVASTTNTTLEKDFSGSQIVIPEGNYRSVTSVTAETTGVISSSNYEVTYTHADFTITFDETVNINDEDMTIVFETGYIISTYPPKVRQAVLVKIHDLYDPERGSYGMSAVKDNDVFNILLNPLVKKTFV